MSHPYHHSISSALKYGGIWQDYIDIHNWFDETKAHYPDMRHRTLRHHAEGIFWCEQKFGTVITNSDGKNVPVRFVAEQHIKEDIGYIPTIKDYLDCMEVQNWMYKPGIGRRESRLMSESYENRSTEKLSETIKATEDVRAEL
jgi:hypothetical protein